jgi:exodeoxyribonuclease VII small subunit
MTKSKEPGYDKAILELQSIVEKMQEGNIGLEALQDHTKKALELIRYCRLRLRHIEENVDQLLDSAGPGDTDQ